MRIVAALLCGGGVPRTLTPGIVYKRPPRQTTVRLSRAQMTALADALTPTPLTRPVLHTVEDGLCGYWQQQKAAALIQSRRGVPVNRTLQRMRAAARVLLAGFMLDYTIERTN